MSTHTSRRPATGPWIGVLLGLVALGLLVAFAIGLPKAVGDDEGPSSAPLTLPATLPGGYPAADRAGSFADGDLAAQADQIAQQQSSTRKHGNRVLPQVLGAPAVTRTYVVDGTQPVYVQAFRAEGGAFAPNELPDGAEGQASTDFKRVGDGACILSYQQSAQGQPAAVAYTQCQVSDDGLTVQIASAGLPAKKIVGIADDLVEDLQDQ